MDAFQINESLDQGQQPQLRAPVKKFEEPSSKDGKAVSEVCLNGTIRNPEIRKLETLVERLLLQFLAHLLGLKAFGLHKAL